MTCYRDLLGCGSVAKWELRPPRALPVFSFLMCPFMVFDLDFCCPLVAQNREPRKEFPLLLQGPNSFLCLSVCVKLVDLHAHPPDSTDLDSTQGQPPTLITLHLHLPLMPRPREKKSEMQNSSERSWSLLVLLGKGTEDSDGQGKGQRAQIFSSPQMGVRCPL